MKVLLYGSKGWIGTMIVNKWKEMYPEHTIIASTTRVIPENFQELHEEIKEVDRVFCTIGRTSGGGINNIDYLETHLNENVRDNLFAPMFLAQICQLLNKHFSYIGTGCIFSRNTHKNDYLYEEGDTPDFFGSSYSIVKGYTDSLMKTFSNFALNLRIRMPITDDYHSKNFITKISKFENICNYPNSMSYLPDLIPIMIHMSVNEEVGTYNMVNGHTSHKDILEKYKKIVDKTHTYKLIEEEELSGILKAKRSNNILKNDKLKVYCFDNGLSFRPLEKCIDEALNNIKLKLS